MSNPMDLLGRTDLVLTSSPVEVAAERGRLVECGVASYAELVELRKALEAADLIPRAAVVAWLERGAENMALTRDDLRDAGATTSAATLDTQSVALAAAAARIKAGNPWEADHA